MGNLINWKPLTFWDESQINELNKQKILDCVAFDDEFIFKKKQYMSNESKIDSLKEYSNQLVDELYDIIKENCKKSWLVPPLRNQLYLYI